MNKEKAQTANRDFAKKAGSVINWTLGIPINVYAKSNICVSESASSQSPKTLVAHRRQSNKKASLEAIASREAFSF